MALRAFVSIGLAALWLGLFAPPMFLTPPTVSTGVHFISTGALIQRNIVRIDPGSPAYKAGLRSGDVLGCLSYRDGALLLSPSFGSEQGYRAGTPISTCVRHEGTLQTVQFVANVGPPVENAYGSNALAALRLCVVLVFLLTGIVLVMARPGLMTWIFYVYCLASAPCFPAEQVWTILPAWQYLIASGLPTIGCSSAVLWLLLFSIVVPGDGIPAGWRRTAFYVAGAGALLYLSYVLAYIFWTDVTFSDSAITSVEEGLTAVTILVVVTRLITMQRAERARFGWAAFAIIFGVVADYLRNVLAVGPLGNAAGDLTVVMPLCLMYAILKRRVFDLGFVLSRTIVVATISLIVVAAFVLLEWMLGTVLAGVSHVTGLLANAGLALVLGLSMNYIHKRVDAAVDAILFRKRHQDERSLLDFSKEASYVTEPEALLDQTIAQIQAHTDARNAAILLDGAGAFTVARSFGGNVPSVGENDGAILALKTWHKPLDPHHYATSLRGALALPMVARGRLLGVLLLGERAGGEAYAPDEVEALSQLAHGVGSALDVLAGQISDSSGVNQSLIAIQQTLAAVQQTLSTMHQANVISPS